MTNELHDEYVAKLEAENRYLKRFRRSSESLLGALLAAGEASSSASVIELIARFSKQWEIEGADEVVESAMSRPAMRTASERELRYLGHHDGRELCCKITGIDKYGKKQPCGKRACYHYQAKGGGNVYLCDGCRPNVMAEISRVLSGMSDLLGKAARPKP